MINWIHRTLAYNVEFGYYIVYLYNQPELTLIPQGTMMIKKIIVLSISLAFSTFALAEGSASAGKNKSASCASCHGDNGNSMVSTFPKLAGQHENYLIRQLQDFKDGFRNAPMMVPLAMALSDQDVDDIAAYYATQKITQNQRPILMNDDDDDEESEKDNSEEIDELLALGSDLYRNGNLSSEVSACIACHGPSGEGNEPAEFPSLRGQHADYLIKALSDFKKGSRNKSNDKIMQMIATKMTDEEIQAVSFHISMKK